MPEAPSLHMSHCQSYLNQDFLSGVFTTVPLRVFQGPPGCELELPGPVAFYRGFSPQMLDLRTSHGQTS